MKVSIIILVFILFSQINYGYLSKVDGSNYINVFIDCNRCDLDYIRKEVTFVNYVWDRGNSDVHILFSSLRTGGGGREFTLTFLGQNQFVNVNDTLHYFISESDTQDDERIKMVKVIKLGLIKYVSKSEVVDNIKIIYNQPNNAISNIDIDEWDYWVFRTRLGGWTSGEKSSNSLNLWGSISANRITDDIKFKFSVNGRYYENIFEFDNETYTSISRHQGIYTSLIKSYNDHWSYGLFANVYASRYNNISFNVSTAPGIEYNIFPYSEATRKQLRLAYRVFLAYNDYNEETVYFKDEELIGSEKLTITLELVQPWGNIETTLSGAHYFHDFNLHSVELSNEFRISVTKGLTIDLYGRLAYIHDQISLPRSGVELEEVLLQQKQLETNYEYRARFGFTYSFGSIFNNIVNTRFGN